MKNTTPIVILICMTLAVSIVLWYGDKRENSAPLISVESGASYSKKIIAFWDSLTAGYGVDLEDSYPSILKSILNQNLSEGDKIEVINMGVSGETSSGAIERVDFIIQQNPNIVLLGIGANDMLRGTNPQITKDNIESIISRFQDKNITVILLGIQSQSSNGPEYTRAFNALYPQLAKKYNAPLVASFLQWVALVTELNIADGIHPNRAGYEKIVQENILPTVQAVLEK